MFDARELVDLASDAAFAISADLRVVAWNRAATDVLGLLPSEAVGQNCYEVLKGVLPDGQPLCVPTGCEGLFCLARGWPFAVRSCRIRHKDGRWIRASLSTLVMPEGSAHGCGRHGVALVFLRTEGLARRRSFSARPLRIFTFGCFGLTVGDRGVATDKWERKQALTLLKLLVTELGRAVHRERLAECLWPDADEMQGRKRLKVTVYSLRRRLRAAGVKATVVQTVGPAYLLRRDAVWVDSDAFQELVTKGSALERRGHQDAALQHYEDAQLLYRGDYLEEDLYADWCAEERERLRELYLDVLAGMVRGYANRGDHARAAQVCRVALVREPCREGFYRDLMECLLRLGHPDQALAQYERCRRVLAEELGTEPMPETQRMYRHILGCAEAKPAKITASRAERTGPAV